MTSPNGRHITCDSHLQELALATMHTVRTFARIMQLPDYLYGKHVVVVARLALLRSC